MNIETIDLAKIDTKSVGTKTKAELVSLIKAYKASNENLLQKINYFEKEADKIESEWVEDEERILRCRHCRTKAPWVKEQWTKTQQWKVPYCMRCGRKMKNAED